MNDENNFDLCSILKLGFGFWTVFRTLPFCVLNDGKKAENKWYYTFKSVIIFGRIKIITNENEKHDILTKLGNKYFPTEEDTNNVINKLFKQTEVLKIEIKHITGKKVNEK